MLQAIGITLGMVLLLAQAYAQKSTLPIPRFVSLKADKVNFHVGPGTDYPTEWQYTRKGLPVEVIAEFGHWRLLRDIKGSQGWVHRSLLSGKRHVIVTSAETCKIFEEPNKETAVLGMLEKGVICKVLKCQKTWCYIQIEDIKGWVRRKDIWGTYPHEVKF